MLPALSWAQTVNICDRTPQVRDAIVQMLGTDDCAAVNSASVVSLDLSDKQLTTLQAGDFDSLTRLQTLGLQGNRLSALPQGAFDSLTSLRYLYLNENRFSALPAGLFDGLTSLRNLANSKRPFGSGHKPP